METQKNKWRCACVCHDMCEGMYICVSDHVCKKGVQVCKYRCNQVEVFF